MTKVQLLLWKVYDSCVVYHRTLSRQILQRFLGRAQKCRNQFDEYDPRGLHCVKQTSEKAKGHQCSPYAVKIEDRPQEGTERQERCARWDAWKLARFISELKEKEKSNILLAFQGVDFAGRIHNKLRGKRVCSGFWSQNAHGQQESVTRLGSIGFSNRKTAQGNPMHKVLGPIGRIRVTQSTLRQASIREKKGPSLVKNKCQSSSSANSLRHEIWGQVPWRDWTTTAMCPMQGLEPFQKHIQAQVTQSTPRQASIREKKGPSLVKNERQSSSSANSLRHEIWGQVPWRVWTVPHSTFPRKSGYSQLHQPKEPEEREFAVDSGASMHLVSKKDLNSADLETVRMSRNPTTVMTANDEVLAKEEATVYVRELDLFVTVMLLENTPAVISLGKLCEGHGYTYHWTSGQKPQLIKNGRRTKCNTANNVPFVVLGSTTSSCRSQNSQWRMWIEEQSSICRGGTRFGHPMDPSISVQNQNFTGNSKKLAKVLGAR